MDFENFTFKLCENGPSPNALKLSHYKAFFKKITVASVFSVKRRPDFCTTMESNNDYLFSKQKTSCLALEFEQIS